jgi:hypothetical protein
MVASMRDKTSLGSCVYARARGTTMLYFKNEDGNNSGVQGQQGSISQSIYQLSLPLLSSFLTHPKPLLLRNTPVIENHVVYASTDTSVFRARHLPSSITQGNSGECGGGSLLHRVAPHEVLKAPLHYRLRRNHSVMNRRFRTIAIHVLLLAS